MNILTMEDINYLTQQSTERINIILSGMTTLMNDIDNKVEGIEYQGWFQRMAKTVLGKNKITQAEIQQNYDKLNAYMSEAIGELFNRNCIDHEIMMSLGTQLNELYADHVNLKQLLGTFVSKLNEKIDSVDNFHMLNTEINQGKYSSYTPIIAICKIISQFDKRILEEPRKLDILKRSMIEQNIINNEEVLLSDYLMNIIDIAAEEVGAIYLELGTIRSNFISNILLNMMERYHFLPDMERRLKSKNNLIEDVIKNKKLDKTIKLSINDIYNDFLNSKIDTQNNIIAIENVQNDNIENTKDITIKEYKNSKNLINNARETYKNIYECIEYVNMKIKDLPKESYPELQRMDNLINMVHFNNDIVEDMTIEQYNIHIDNLMELLNLFYKYITLNNHIAIENVQNDNIENTKDITIKEYKNSKNLINDAREMYKNIYECIEYVNIKIKDLPKESHPELQRMDNLINMVHSNNDIVEDMTIEQYNIHIDNLMELSNLFYKYITLNDQKESSVSNFDIENSLYDSKIVEISEVLSEIINYLCVIFTYYDHGEDVLYYFDESDELKSFLDIYHCEKIYLSFMCDHDGFAITSDGIYHRNSKESYATHVSFKELLESDKIYWKNNHVYADDKLLAYNSSTLFKDDLVILIKKIVEQVEQGGSALDRYSLKAIAATLVKGCNESKSAPLNRLNNETLSGIMKALCALFVLEDYIDKEDSNYYIATDDEIKSFLDIYYCDEIYLSFMCDYDGFAITSDGIYHRKSEESYATHVSFKELLKLKELYWKDNYIYTDDKLLAYNSGSALFKDKLVNLIGKIIDEQDEQGRYHLYGYGLESALYRYELENTVMNILKERGAIEDDGNVF